jgi:hypothetical protein
VRQREIRAEVDRLLQLDHRLIGIAAQPLGAPHRPVSGGVAIVGHQALPGRFERTIDFGCTLCPALERVLEMRE